MTRPVVFFWENFGPMHVDRVEAVHQTLGRDRQVLGLEFRSTSDVYDWDSAVGSFKKQTLFARGKEPGAWGRIAALVKHCRAIGRGDYFLCHYEWPEVFALACVLRLTGSRVVTMGCSKFDDVPRSAWREALKTLFLAPYNAAIASGKRSRDYFRYLGIPANRVSVEYNTVSVSRIRTLAGASVTATVEGHVGRPFIAVARLVEKKNLSMLLSAYALYRSAVPAPRQLDIYGSGPLLADLQGQARQLGVSDLVQFKGFVQTDGIAAALARSLALLLPSSEEQFGNVIIEAQAVGLPAVISDVAGARDHLVRSGVNGFVVEPDNPEGLAYFMQVLSEQPEVWSRLSKAASTSAVCGDVARFVEAVTEQITPPARAASARQVMAQRE